MKVKNFLFVTIFLAAASLGLALPPPKNSTETLPHKDPKGSTETLPHKDPTVTPPNKAGGTAKTDSTVQFQTTVLDAAKAAGGVSKDCAAALLVVFTSVDFLTCIPPTALLPLLPVVSDPSILQKVLADPATNYPKLVEKPLIQAATGLCAAPKCTDDFIGSTIKTIQDGCKEDLTNNKLIQALLAGFVFYSPSRDSLCFKDKDQFCFDETILAITKLPASPFPISGNKLVDSIAVSDPDTICSECNKEIINTIFNYLKDRQDKKDPLPFAILKQFGIEDKQIQGGKIGAIVKCGLQFLNGSTQKN